MGHNTQVGASTSTSPCRSQPSRCQRRPAGERDRRHGLPVPGTPCHVWPCLILHRWQAPCRIICRGKKNERQMDRDALSGRCASISSSGSIGDSELCLPEKPKSYTESGNGADRSGVAPTGSIIAVTLTLAQVGLFKASVHLIVQEKEKKRPCTF